MPGPSSCPSVTARAAAQYGRKQTIMLIAKLALGAVIGGVLGFFMGRAKVCSAAQCQTRGNMMFTIIACAVVGAAVAYHVSAGP